MRTSYQAILTSLAVLLCGCCKQFNELTQADIEAAESVKSITIEFDHMGWGSLHERFVIEAQGKNFLRNGDGTQDYAFKNQGAEGRLAFTGPVTVESVAKLMQSMDSVAMKRDNGLDSLARMLQISNVDKDTHLYTSSTEACHQEVKAEYQRRLQGRAWIRSAADRYFMGGWTDDYPSIRISIKHKNGRVSNLVSEAQPILMLPWDRDGAKTWDYRLSIAVSGLLPKESAAYRRLSLDRLADALADEMLMEIWREEHENHRICA